MFRLAVVAVVVAMVMAKPLDLNDEWEVFKSHYKKNYNAAQEMQRRAIWESNLQFIEKHNLAADRGEHSYWLGVNEYADLTTEEFVRMMNGYKMSNSTRRNPVFLPPLNLKDLPTEVDWRQKGYVTPVKNQGQCGSCWAFSTTGSLEGQHFRATGKLVSLSEQNLVDCSKPEGNHGCHGGLMDNGFEYIKANKGIDTEKSYPYTAKDGRCKFQSGGVGATVSGFADVPGRNETALKQAVATIGPISVVMDASPQSFMHYRTGVYDDPKCSSFKLDHAVLIVGYGTTAQGQDYWLIKNSWGTGWGKDGYFMLARNNNNQCGIADLASYPTV